MPLAVVDTVGAGDCFLAGLVASMLQPKVATDWGSATVKEEVARVLLSSAIASASLCVMQRGCVPPTRAEVLQRMGSVEMAFVV